MKPPKFSYTFDGRKQAIHGADRPVCAAVAGLASMTLRGVLVKDPAKVVGEWLEDQLHPARLQKWVRALRGARYSGTPPDTVLGLTLDRYQLEAITRMSFCGGVLALGCGLGKTAIATSAAMGMGGPRCWIACPLNAMPAWRRVEPELRKEFAEVVIVSIDSLHKTSGIAHTGGVIIFDEVHLLGENKSRRTKAAHKLRQAFDIGICLTGTLLHAGMHKVLSIQDLAVPGMAGYSSTWRAGEAFKCIVTKELEHKTVRALERPSGEQFEKFQQYLSRNVQSMTTQTPVVRAAFQLPTQHSYKIEFNKPWASLEEAAAVCAEEVLEETGELPHFQAIVHRLLRSGADEKIEWMTENVGDEQVVVFAQYQESLDRLCSAFPDHVRVDGEITGNARTDAERRFQDKEVQFFIGQITAASVSMNLQNAIYSIGFDFSRRATDYAQALARTARRGQTDETHHFDLVANRLQDMVVRRLRAGQDFDSSVAEWQAAREYVNSCHQS